MVLKNFTLYLDPALIGLKDSTTDDYPLMNSPLEPTAIVALYSLFLFNLGPKFMKNRDAFSLKKVMMVYNFVQVVLNFVVFLMVAKLMPNFNLCCNPVNTSNSPEDIAIRRAHYCYTLLKFLDLFDTVPNRYLQNSFIGGYDFRSFLSYVKNINRLRFYTSIII
ncbi:hypothetical protein MTP99_002447 [Tenebrio molitor]|nr:hypothetical protein MTP99_002447 [Tenebrio molitor]